MKSLFEIPSMGGIFWLDPKWFSLQCPWRDKYTKIQQYKQVKIHNSVGNGADKHPQFDVDENISIIQIFCKEVWQNESKDKICMVWVVKSHS